MALLAASPVQRLVHAVGWGEGGKFWVVGGWVCYWQPTLRPPGVFFKATTNSFFFSVLFWIFFYISCQYVSSVQKIELYNTMVVECRKGLIGNSDLADNQLDHNLRGILSSRALLCGSDLDIKYKYFIFNRCILLKKSIHSKHSKWECVRSCYLLQKKFTTLTEMWLKMKERM